MGKRYPNILLGKAIFDWGERYLKRNILFGESHIIIIEESNIQIEESNILLGKAKEDHQRGSKPKPYPNNRASQYWGKPYSNGKVISERGKR